MDGAAQMRCSWRKQRWELTWPGVWHGVYSTPVARSHHVRRGPCLRRMTRELLDGNLADECARETHGKSNSHRQI